MDGHVTILLFSIIVILFVYIGIPVGNQELDEFLLPRIIGKVDGHVITAPPLGFRKVKPNTADLVSSVKKQRILFRLA